MNALDYYNNPDVRAAIGENIKHIKNRQDREDCSQEIFAELYNLMPLDTEEAVRLVNRVAAKFKYGLTSIAENEIGYTE